MKNFELITFATTGELALRAADTWLRNWEGRRVAVPIFLCKYYCSKIWVSGAPTFP